MFIQVSDEHPSLVVSDPGEHGVTRIIWESVSNAFDPSDLAIHQGALWFVESSFETVSPLNLVSVMNLWRTDGTESGTQVRAQIDGFSFYFTPLLAGTEQRLFFEANGTLWSSDGTQAGSLALTEAFGVDFPIPLDFVSLPDQLLFSALDATSGFEIWRSDGTITGTQLFRDLEPGPQSSFGQVLASDRQQVL